MSKFSFWVLFFIVFLLQDTTADRQEQDRNVLHFTPKSFWQGPPTGLVETKDGILHLYYEKPADDKSQVSPKVVKWGSATSNDGVMWRDENALLVDKTAKGVSYKQGTANLYHSSDTEQQVVGVATRYEASKKAEIVSFQSAEGNVASFVGKDSMISGVTSGEIFSIGGTFFFAATSPSNDKCNVQFASLKMPFGPRKSLEIESIFDTNTVGGMRADCTGIQIRQIPDSEYFIETVTGSRFAAAPPQTIYQIIKPIGQARGIIGFGKFDLISAGVFDYGYDAGYFKFSMYNGSLVAIGWNGNTKYENSYPTEGWRNGMTSLRKIEYSNGMVYQTPILNSKYKEGSSNVGKVDKTLNVDACSFSWDLSKIGSKVNGMYTLDLDFSDLRQFAKGGFHITLLSGKQSLVVKFMNNKYSIDRTNTESFEGSKGFEIVESKALVSTKALQKVKIVIDTTIIEVFGNNGTSVLTSSFFFANKARVNKVCIGAIVEKVTLSQSSTVTKYIRPNGSKPQPDRSPALIAIPALLLVLFSL